MSEASMPRVGIVGYYGADSRMNSGNMDVMRAECAEIITEDFGLDLTKCVLVGNGGTWTNHLPVELWKQQPEQNGANLILVMAFAWDRQASKFSESSEVAKKINNSHRLMQQRLNYQTRGLKDIGAAVDKGAQVIEENGMNLRNSTFAKLCDYLIYMPMREGDGNDFFGVRIFNNFKGPKRIVCLEDFL